MSDDEQSGGGDDLRTLEDILDELESAGDGGAVSINDVLDTFADRSLGALLTVLGAIAALPLVGGIPGISVVLGLLIVAMSLRTLVGKGCFRLPGALGDREVDEEKLRSAVEKGRPWAARIDACLKPRLNFLTREAPQRAAIAVAASVLGMCMVPLELVPWGSTVPALGVVTFGLALIGRDGLFALVGVAATAGTVAFVLQTL